MTTLTRDAVRAAGACSLREQRTLGQALADAHLQTRATDENAGPLFVGHAAVFNNRTAIGDPLRWGWYEEVASSAFDKTLKEGDARFLNDHRTEMLVARVSAGDLRLATDKVGLGVESDLDTELSYVRDLVRNLDKRRITGMSFGFYVVRDKWEEIEVEVDVDVDGKTERTSFTVYLRTLEEVNLLEVSTVTFPAYEDTDAAVRAAEIRSARGIPTELPSAAEGIARPAPAAAAATRDERNTDPAPARATRGFERLDERATALAIRYRLPR